MIIGTDASSTPEAVTWAAMFALSVSQQEASQSQVQLVLPLLCAGTPLAVSAAACSFLSHPPQRTESPDSESLWAQQGSSTGFRI